MRLLRSPRPFPPKDHPLLRRLLRRRNRPLPRNRPTQRNRLLRSHPSQRNRPLPRNRLYQRIHPPLRKVHLFRIRRPLRNQEISPPVHRSSPILPVRNRSRARRNRSSDRTLSADRVLTAAGAVIQRNQRMNRRWLCGGRRTTICRLPLWLWCSSRRFSLQYLRRSRIKPNHRMENLHNQYPPVRRLSSVRWDHRWIQTGKRNFRRFRLGRQQREWLRCFCLENDGNHRKNKRSEW